MIELEVGKQYWHVIMFPAAVRVQVMSVEKKFWFLQKVTLKPIYAADGEQYTVWGSPVGFSDEEFYPTSDIFPFIMHRHGDTKWE